MYIQKKLIEIAKKYDKDKPMKTGAIQRRLSRRFATAFVDHYKTLGVPYNADNAEIKHAFFVAAKKYHPDKFGNSKDSVKK